MSQLLGVERDSRKERQSDGGQELNSSPALPPSPSDSLPLKLSGSRDPERVSAYSHTSILHHERRLYCECVRSVSGEKESVTGKTGGEKPRKRQNEREVSSFRFTVVVGEIWLCSYSTLRPEPEEEHRDRFTW